jgi:hypothetical protein
MNSVDLIISGTKTRSLKEGYIKNKYHKTIEYKKTQHINF